MPSFEAGPLPKKLPELHKELQVERAVERAKQGGERIPNTPEAQIDTYLNRLDKILAHPDEQQRKRNLALLKPFLHDAFIISEDSFPESYFELQKRVYRERGITVEEFAAEDRQKMIDVIREDQTHSLDEWIDYLTSSDAGYPTWFKYLAFRNITRLSQFDKERGRFKRRSKDTTAIFPDIYREALGSVADRLSALGTIDIQALKDLDTKRAKSVAMGEEYELTEEEKEIPYRSFEEFETYAQGRFPDLYAQEIQLTLEASLEGRENIEGEWVVYEQGDKQGVNRLYQSLQGKGTGWCTAGKVTAEEQVQQGDFHVYYTFKDKGDSLPTQPRIAIRMQNNEIAEVRGVLPNQEMEPLLQDIVDTKLQEFGGKADKFKMKSEDMRRMTALDAKQSKGEELTIDELKFLYEVDRAVNGFGYRKDPRIYEIQAQRDALADRKEILTTYSEDEQYEFTLGRLAEFFTPLLQVMGEEKLVDRLMRDEKFMLILEKRESLSSVDADNLIDRIVKSGQGDRLLESHYLLKQDMTVDELMHELILLGQADKVANCSLMQNPNAMYRFSKEIADDLITAGYVDVVLSKRHKFEDMTEDTLTLLVEKASPMVLLEEKRWLKLNSEQEDKLIKGLVQGEHIHELASNIRRFSEEKHPAILAKVLEGGHARDLYHSLQDFKGIDYNKTVHVLAERGELEQLTNSRVSDWREIGVDFNFIAQELLQRESVRKIDRNFDFFQDLSAETLINIVAAEPRIAIRILERLDVNRKTGLNWQYTHLIVKGDMVDTILSSDELIKQLIPSLKYIKRSMPEALAIRLLELGEGATVVDNFGSFEPLSQETLLKLQPYMEGYSYQMAA